MTTPDEINEIISTQVDLEFPKPVGGFENPVDEDEWHAKKENRFTELCTA